MNLYEPRSLGFLQINFDTIKAMIKRGVKFLPTQVDALKIYNKLKEQN